MGIKNWMIGIRKWKEKPNGRRDAYVSAGVFGIAFFFLSSFINRDLSYLWMVGATGLTVAVLAWATLQIAGKRAGYSFSHSLLIIFICMVPLATYRFVFVAIGRPHWMFDGPIFDAFIGCSGALLGGMLQYLRTVGHMQHESFKYKIVFWIIIISTFFVALLFY